MGIKNINLNGVQEQLVSGTNIKTINGNSLLGSGNIVVASTGVPVSTDISSGNTGAAQAGAVADFLIEKSQPNSVKKIINKIRNPFVRSNIKLIGDSITAGQGGTGYNLNGEVIFGPYRVNDYSATCWANSFRDYINNYINGTFLFTGFDNGNISITSNYSFTTLGSRSCALILNTDTSGIVSFDFYGTDLKVEHASTSISGILDVYIDSVYHSSVDAYSASASYNNFFDITGLTEDNHTFELRNTNTRNASSSDNRFYLYGFSIKKFADVKNFGTSGIVSSNLYKERASLIRIGDDIVICQVGVNDRTLDSLNGMNSSLKLLKEYTDSLGLDLVYMISNPMTATVDNQTIKMVHIANELTEISLRLNMNIISNYDYFIDYCTYTGKTLTSLLTDGLHPNDDGYEVMYKGVMNGLGFPVHTT